MNENLHLFAYYFFIVKVKLLRTWFNQSNLINRRLQKSQFAYVVKISARAHFRKTLNICKFKIRKILYKYCLLYVPFCIFLSFLNALAVSSVNRWSALMQISRRLAPGTNNSKVSFKMPAKITILFHSLTYYSIKIILILKSNICKQRNIDVLFGILPRARASTKS